MTLKQFVARRSKKENGKKQEQYSRTYSIRAEETDGYDTVTVVFGHSIDRDRVNVLDREVKCALQVYYGPESDIRVSQ